MVYTNKALAVVWLLALGLFGLAGSGVVADRWLLLLVAAALVVPAIVLTLLPRPAIVAGAITAVYASALVVPVASAALTNAPLIEQPTGFRLRATMRQGTAASLPSVWERYPTVDAARAQVRGMYANDRVSRVLIVTDDVPPRFVEWVDR